MNAAVLQYFDRAVCGLTNASNDATPPSAKSHLTAMAVHACQSLREALDQLADDETNPDPQLKAAIKGLPHAHLIENIRHLDLHGWPLPICDPKKRRMAMVAKPGQPIKLSSSHGVGVSIQMEGLKPVVHRTPKDLKHGSVEIGGATVSLGCDEGKLIVHDFSTGESYLLLEVLGEFLQHCHALIKDRTPPDSEPEQPAEPADGE